MRTTIRLDDALLRETKRIASETGKTMAEVVEDALREAIARRRAAQQRKPVELPTFKGQGLQPGVDLDDSAGLLELMERPGATP